MYEFAAEELASARTVLPGNLVALQLRRHALQQEPDSVFQWPQHRCFASRISRANTLKPYIPVKKWDSAGSPNLYLFRR